jgi:hypothetical protein
LIGLLGLLGLLGLFGLLVVGIIRVVRLIRVLGLLELLFELIIYSVVRFLLPGSGTHACVAIWFELYNQKCTSSCNSHNKMTIAPVNVRGDDCASLSVMRRVYEPVNVK